METALYKHVQAIYDFMHNNSTINKHGERVYEGYFREAFQQSGASTRYYTPIRELLDSPELDPCISVAQRGNSYQPSIFVLHHPPPEEWGAVTAQGLTGGGIHATVVGELSAEVERLKAWRESLGEVNLREALVNMERRITRLERELK